MKFKTFLIAVLIGFFAAGAQAGTLKVSQSLVDFGSHKEGPAIKKSVTLTNRGDTPLKIANVTTS